MTPARLWLTAAAATAGIATMGFAQQNDAASQLPGIVDASRVTAGTYAADPAHTLVGWRVNHFGFNDYFGIFGDISGTLEIDPDNLAGAKVDVTIPVAAVTVASEGLKNHLLRPGKDGADPDFFGPEPDAARFVSTGVTVEDDGVSAVIDGNLTLNGVTQPVKLRTRFTGAGDNPFNKKATVGFEAGATIKRSDFGIEFALPIVSDTVQLDISAAFEKE